MEPLPRRLAAAFATSAILLGAAAAAAQTDVAIEKRTNGVDADTPPGPVLSVGAPVTWTYIVSNTSGRDLVAVAVTDDQGVTVTCPATTIPAGESMTCTGSGVAVAGQYANIGTVSAELTDGSPVSASDPSHYFGQAAVAIDLEKSTNGVDADTPPGPILPVGAPVLWTYTVTNLSAVPLSQLAVTDDQGVTVTCPTTTLDAGESMTCTASGIAEVGQYTNLGTATGELPDNSLTADSDPSHYFGQLLSLEKATNGVDADLPPGPVLEVGAAVTWTYVVLNPGPATVTNLAVTDDQGVTVTCPVTTLAAGESTTCSGAGTAQAGQYANLGTASAQLPGGATITDSDPSHYLGTTIRIEKSTNGVDADLPPGPVLAIGAAVNWTYTVTNLAADTLTGLAVTDDQGVTVTCPANTLAAAAAMTCTANGIAVAGQYSNIGTVTATHPTLGEVAASDRSHYFGQDQVLDFGDAADSYPTSLANSGARHVLGGAVHLGACVDSELDATAGAAANSDDGAVGISTFGTCATAGDDEDGVALTAPLTPGSSASVEVTASAACTLSAWIDFSGDGDFADGGESLFPGGVLLAAGLNALAVTLPPTAVAGVTAARFRCTTVGEVPPGGAAADGEVEDYQVTIELPPAMSATKTVSLTGDTNGDAAAGPGDTLTYTIVISNAGGAAAGVVFSDTPDANSNLAVGSVTTTAGTVTTGNNPGDTSVAVDLGTLAGGASATVTFAVTLPDPLPDGVGEVLNQGLVTGSNFADVVTDDPTTGGSDDPTAIALGAAPSILEIPTLGPGALAILGLLLAAAALTRRRVRVG